MALFEDFETRLASPPEPVAPAETRIGGHLEEDQGSPRSRKSAGNEARRPASPAERFAEIRAVARQVRSQKASQVRAELLPTITAIQATGASSLRAIAAELNARDIQTPRRLGERSAVQVQRVMER